MATATAIVGGAVSLGTAIFGASEKRKARKAAEKKAASQKPVVNPYATLRPSTVGANFRGEQNLRALATTTNALSRSGGRGAAMVSSAAREAALVDQSIAAGLDEQKVAIDQRFAHGEQIKQSVEELRFNNEMQGFAQRYAVGQQTMLGGINSALNTFTSAASPGGAFSSNKTAASPSQPIVGAKVGIQPVSFKPQTLINE